MQPSSTDPTWNHPWTKHSLLLGHGLHEELLLCWGQVLPQLLGQLELPLLPLWRASMCARLRWGRVPRSCLL